MKPGAAKQLLRAGRFPRRLLGGGQRVRADGGAKADGNGNEGDPQCDRGFPVFRAPTTGAGGKIQ